MKQIITMENLMKRFYIKTPTYTLLVDGDSGDYSFGIKSTVIEGNIFKEDSEFIKLIRKVVTYEKNNI